jgi:Na+/H+ antiporter NhaD/arsenite permease-like protein
MSPIGNPQNLLVTVNSGMEAPFLTFFFYLLIPTLISIGIAFIMLRLFYSSEFGTRSITHDLSVMCDSRLTVLTKISLTLIVVLAGVNIIASLAGAKMIVTLPLIAVCAAAPILIFSGQRSRIFTQIDWPTLVFFAAMFILMESVWLTGFFQSFVASSTISSVPMILSTSIIISQFISNVPFVALFQPMIQQAGGTPGQLMALAAGSTIAGNLTILGAASNVIIIQNAEKQGETITFWEFVRIGVPLTIIQVVVYWTFLVFI